MSGLKSVSDFHQWLHRAVRKTAKLPFAQSRRKLRCFMDAARSDEK
jgi:hypothetical protein